MILFTIKGQKFTSTKHGRKEKWVKTIHDFYFEQDEETGSVSLKIIPLEPIPGNPIAHYDLNDIVLVQE